MSKQRKRFDLDGFRRAAKDGADVSEAIVCTPSIGVVKEVNEEDRSVRFTISTDSIDRHGDTVSVDGWKLENYRKNPVVLWGHDYSMLPVGKARDLRVEDGKLKATVVFTAQGVSRFNDTVFELIKGGFLNATSVGFSPKKWSWSEDDDRRLGIDFEEQELLEFSVVSVPANPEALIEARSAGADLAPVEDWARKTLGMSEGDRVIPADRLAALEEAEKALADMRKQATAPEKTKDAAPPRRRLEESALALAKLARGA